MNPYDNNPFNESNVIEFPRNESRSEYTANKEMSEFATAMKSTNHMDIQDYVMNEAKKAGAVYPAHFAVGFLSAELAHRNIDEE